MLPELKPAVLNLHVPLTGGQVGMLVDWKRWVALQMQQVLHMPNMVQLQAIASQPRGGKQHLSMQIMSQLQCSCCIISSPMHQQPRPFSGLKVANSTSVWRT